ncbi:MAG: lipopolysaccharide biosynthesis protein [Ekhidna sp.]
MLNPTQLNLKGKLKFLLKDSFVYGFANAFTKLAFLLVFPLLTRFFSVEEFGLIDTLTVLSFFLINTLTFGQDSAVIRFFYDHEKDEEKKQTISESFTILAIGVATFIPVLLLFSSQLSDYYFRSDSNYSELVKLVLYQVPLGIVINFVANVLRLQFKKKQFLIVTLGSTMSYIIGLLIAITLFAPTVYNVLQIMLFSRGVFAIVGIILIKNWLDISFKFKYLKQLLVYAIPYGIICTADSFLPTLDRYFIGVFFTPHHLGLYAAGYKVALLIQLPIQAFQAAWVPFYTSMIKARDSSETYRSVAIFFTCILTVAVLTIILFGNDFLTILASSKYASAEIIILPIVLGLAFKSIGSVFSIGIDISKKSYLKIYGYIIGILFSVLFVNQTANNSGFWVISVGFMIGLLINTVLTSILSHRVHKIDFNYWKSFYLMIIVMIIGFIMQFQNIILFQEFPILKVLIIVFYMIFIWTTQLKSEIDKMNSKS